MNKILMLTATLVLQSCATYAPDQHTDTNEFDEPIIETETAPELKPASDNIDRYECKGALASSWDNILVKLVADPSDNTGAVSAAGTSHEAVYLVEGFERNWYFGDLDKKQPSYSISLRLGELAYYFDYSFMDKDGVTTSKHTFECRQTN